jgi:sugar lactone lactonase YvrE
MTPEIRVLLEGLRFGEGPRWHEGKLWFSDMGWRRVMTVDMEGNAETIAEVPASPSGLGWLPDGRLLVVSMADRRLLRLDPEGLTEVADLSGIAPFHCNDMVVDRQGRAYIGHFGFHFGSGESFAPASIIMVTPDGKVSIAAEDMAFPNGTVITPDDSTLIIAESHASRLTAFDINPDGSLTGRRVWAELGEGVGPDGICLDAEGGIWVASPFSSEVFRVCEGGEVTHHYKTPSPAFACMLGGDDRRTLFIMTSKQSPESSDVGVDNGCIVTMTVDVPGAGQP